MMEYNSYLEEVLNSSVGSAHDGHVVSSSVSSVSSGKNSGQIGETDRELGNGQGTAYSLPQVSGAMSTICPELQIHLDSTSLSEFKTCPRKYQYRILQGWQSCFPKVDLEFGIWYHGALERYDHGKAEGLGHEDSMDKAVDWLLRATWNKSLSRPWFSENVNKNRGTLLRTVVDYLDRFGEKDPLKTVILSTGKPAVELSFSFWSGYNSKLTGEPINFCGHLDRLVEMSGMTYVLDRKTTKSTISKNWFAGFSPNNQFSLYIFATQVLYNLPTQGLIVDGAQIAVGFSRFERGLVSRTRDQLEEWHRDTGIIIRQMEECARNKYWPMNDQGCDRYGGCQFRKVCSQPCGSRNLALKLDFRKELWDPTRKRGDV